MRLLSQRATLGALISAVPLLAKPVLLTSSLSVSNLATRDTASANFSTPLPLLTRQDDDADDIEVLFSISKLAAIGDSYSAGIGAGGRLGTVSDALTEGSDYACSRYDNAYPYLLNNDFRLGAASSRTFQFLSCSGAHTTDVVDKQIGRLNDGQQVILLSAGGNDVRLTDLLNQCVFQYLVLSQAGKDLLATVMLKDANKDYAWLREYDLDSTSRGCDAQMDYSQQMIESTTFSDRLDRVISAAKSKLTPDGVVYYTGYAKFFGEDLTSECDSITWSIWAFVRTMQLLVQDALLIRLHHGQPDLFQPTAMLSRSVRARLNSMVDMVNAKLAAAVERAGPQVEFINYDQYVGRFGGRYCEPGVDETPSVSDSREGLMFYKLNTDDPSGGTPWKRSESGEMNGTFGGDLNVFAEITKLVDDRAALKTLKDVPTTNNAIMPNQKNLVVPSILPDGYKRVFHPRGMLHQIISNLVVHHMLNREYKKAGWPQVPEVVVPQTCPYTPSKGGVAVGSDSTQQIALASYINPLADPAAWNRIIAYPSDKVTVVIANVLNGPDSKTVAHWKDVIDRSIASGKKVLGYVRTGYLGVSQQAFKTRLGSGILADWVDQIEQDVDTWYRLYGDAMGGIFFDEGWNDCGPDNIYADLYAFINRNTKRKHPGAFTVLNPGATMPFCFNATMDTLMTFESSYEQYTNHYVPNAWMPDNPNKIWHIVYNVPEFQVSQVIALAQQRGVGMLQITDDVMPNPYDNLPGDSYMQTHIKSINRGSPSVAGPQDYPSSIESIGSTPQLSLVSFDYTSASLGWTEAYYAIGYRVYVRDQFVLELPKTMTRVTVGLLNPGEQNYWFQVKPIGPGGKEAMESNVVQTATPPLPNGRPIANMKMYSNATYDMIDADLLVPFAFERVYVCYPDGTSSNVVGWGLRWNNQLTRWCPMMVEGTNWYEKIGNNGDWSWKPLEPGIAGPASGKYTRTWGVTPQLRKSLATVRNPGSPGGIIKGNDPATFDEATWVVQAEGYGPLTNVFIPCPPSSFGSTDGAERYC